MPTRAERNQERFENLRTALEKTVGREKANGAAWAAWLMAIQYMHKCALQNIARRNNEDDFHIKEAIEELEAESEAVLRSFHKGLCDYLGIDNEDARKLAAHFEQVIHDICFQKG